MVPVSLKIIGAVGARHGPENSARALVRGARFRPWRAARPARSARDLRSVRPPYATTAAERSSLAEDASGNRTILGYVVPASAALRPGSFLNDLSLLRKFRGPRDQREAVFRKVPGMVTKDHRELA